jgi:hypothetical protein
MAPPDDELDLGAPGASARREYERRRAKREARTRAKHPRIGGLMLALQDEPQHQRAWERGAQGEESIARSLAKHCGERVVILHDRGIRGSRANIDHIVVAPSGVWVVDSKRYRGKVVVKRPLFGKPKLLIAGRDRTKLVDGLDRQGAIVTGVMTDASPDVPIRGALCFADADLPLLGTLTFRGHPVVYPRRLAKRMCAGDALSEERIREVAAVLAVRLPSA